MGVTIDISNEFADVGVDITLGVITYSVPSESDAGRVEQAFNAAVAHASQCVREHAPADLEEIAATRRAFKALGKDPSRYRPSSEALYRRIASGKGLWRVNDVVDVNNILSLDTRWPVGSYDLEKVSPPVQLRLGRRDEPYKGVGRSDINIENLTVLADSEGPFGAPFSDSERTKVTDQTRAVLTILYVFGGSQSAKGLCETAAATLQRLGCAAEIEMQLIG